MSRPPKPRVPPSPPRPHPSLSAAVSMRQLLESLSREQRRNQELLASLGFTLRSFTNLSRFLELVPLVSSRLVGAEGSLLVVLQADGRLWKEQLNGSPLERCSDLLRQLADLADQPLDAERLDQEVAMLLGDAPVFAAPVVARNHTWGRLYVFGSHAGLSWSEVHHRHLQLVADLTAVAIENDSLREDSRRHERLDRQLSTGAAIQAQLLPDHCPVIDGVELAARCRPAFEVGGDYYDFIPTHPERLGRQRETSPWALVMGDVMGKGVPAGLLMTLLRGMLRAEVLSRLPPDRILHDLNKLAQEDLSQSHRFVTLFYSDFDPFTRVLRYANAAHNPPLLCRRQGYRVERLDASGLLIGLQLDAEYGCEQVVLEPGDVVLYYTDGVSEAPGPGGERFDEGRLIRSLQAASQAGLSAQDILNQLFTRLDRFVGVSRPLDDDASMVVLKVREEVALPTFPG
ncbi:MULTISPECIES: PP2C family protein-serine/threonine phosphatase [Synechococcales]|uniref:PP2C family protein-serine/threonine phosphatase n=1 Tax=Synechococcus sp. CS-1324 TaxID=2847980 RepID=UPI0037D9ADFA